jgi:hypothetical protein
MLKAAEVYVIRIYSRDTLDRSRVVGMIEIIDTAQRERFYTCQELCTVLGLSCDPPSTRSREDQ